MRISQSRGRSIENQVSSAQHNTKNHLRSAEEERNKTSLSIYLLFFAEIKSK